MYGTGFQVAAHNSSKQREHKQNSGFFIEVKDIDYPEWQIMFSHDNKMETDLKRWMEIFTQYINENQSEKIEAKFIQLMSEWEFDKIANQSEDIQKQWNSFSEEQRSKISDETTNIRFAKHGKKMEEFFNRLEKLPKTERTPDVEKQIRKDVAALNLKESTY